MTYDKALSIVKPYFKDKFIKSISEADGVFLVDVRYSENDNNDMDSVWYIDPSNNIVTVYNPLMVPEHDFIELEKTLSHSDIGRAFLSNYGIN